MRDFWKSAGMHLLERDKQGWLAVTPDYLRAYLTRPEVHPVEESCEAEPTAVPSGSPYCPVDGLVHPPGATYCVRCEADLARDCQTCGTRIGAMDAVCFNCGARQ